MNKITLTSGLIFSMILTISGCQTVSKTTSKVGTWIGKKPTLPEVDAKGVVDISKTTLNQIEQLTETMPTDQWVYIKNKKQEVYTLQNKSKDQYILSLRLNCQIQSQLPTFSLLNPQNQQILTAYDEKLGQIQFLLDNKNFGNPFNRYDLKKLDAFKTALANAKIIKIFNAGKLYRFENQHAELLEKPVSCRD